MDKLLAQVNIGDHFKFGVDNSGNPLGIENKPNYENLSVFLGSILPNIYMIAGIILLFLIIGGGFAIITSNNDPQKKGQGGKAITSALIGFLLLFASYWIIQIIEKITGIPILDV